MEEPTVASAPGATVLKRAMDMHTDLINCASNTHATGIVLRSDVISEAR